jgi:formate dehydrogenase major subunit
MEPGHDADAVSRHAACLQLKSMNIANIQVTIDGIERRVPAGWTVLQALRSLDRAPITLCHDDRLAPIGQCWSCAVEIAAGPDQPFDNRPACHEQLLNGLQVRTQSSALDKFRRQLIGMLAAKVEKSECDRFPDKELHRALLGLGITAGANAAEQHSIDTSHPHLRVDMSRCIACQRCVRICEDLQGESIWHAFGRGAELRIGTLNDLPLAETACVGCGACVDTCPTAALTDQRAWRQPVPEQWTRSTCAYCGVGCSIEVGVAEDRIASVRPVLDAPSNKGHLCAKGRYAHDYVDADDRVTTPLLRSGGAWRRSDWDAAICFATDGLRAIAAKHGADAIGVLASARATNEENYLTQKFARIALGTNNIDCCARVCHTPSAAAMKKMLGTGASTNSFDDIELAASFLIVGANPLENHPVVGARIRQQVRRGAALVVIDPRRTGLAEIADVHLALRPGTNVPMLNALAHVLIAERLIDAGFIAARVDDVDALSDFVSTWTPERAAAICDVPADLIRQAARLYAQRKPAMCFHGLGMTEHVQGTEGVMALINLALLTGNIGRPGTGINPLRGQNNVQGAAHMGCDPAILTGSVPIADARERVAQVWGATPPATRGLNVLGMIDAARDGRLKALYVIGYDIFASLANMHESAQALANLELLIVQDLFLNETAKGFAHVFLPAVSSFEKDGTFMNSERRIQRLRRSLTPRGEARSDAAIICAMAAALGHRAQFDYPDHDQSVWEEICRVWPMGAGISYARIAGHGLQWPCVDAQDPGTALLHRDRFSIGARARLRCIEYRPTKECIDDDYPFLLTTGRVLQQFNVGTMSGRGRQQLLRPTDTVDMHPYDAEQLGLRDGMPIRLSSRHGSAVLPLRIVASIAAGQLFASFHDPARALNRVTGPARDALTDAPEYKVTAVRVELV